MKYTAVLTKDEDGGFDVAVPALPGCRTWGRTKREAIAHAAEAVEAYIESLLKDGDPIPKEVDRAFVEVR
ncbi:MAG: type II toxin-antitoxin system HicB family antitoxin [Planctomycetes bacterium]|nr:type II toxin-antitoxin system HicB family antitoxin [Planctomycetota bacterium]